MSSSRLGKTNPWQDAECLLGRMGMLERRIEGMRARAEARIAEIEQRLEEGEGKLLAEISDIRQELEHFFRENAEGARSRTLDSGRIGLRLVRRLEISRPLTTLRRLTERGLGDCIRIRQEIDRQALTRLEPCLLKELGIKLKEKEVFYARARKEKKDA